MRFRSLACTVVCVLAAVMLMSLLHAGVPGRSVARPMYCVVSLSAESSASECKFGVTTCREALDDPDAEIVGTPLPTRAKAQEMAVVVTRFCQETREVLLDDDADGDGDTGGVPVPLPADPPEEIGCFLLIDPHPFEETCDLRVMTCAEVLGGPDGAVVAGPFENVSDAADAAEILSSACREYMDQTSSLEFPVPDLYIWMSGDESKCAFHVLARREAEDCGDLVAVAGPFVDHDTAAEVAEAASSACRAWHTERELDPCSGEAVPQCSLLRV